MRDNTNIKWEEEQDIAVDDGSSSRLVVHNDEVNTFDWVIETLMEVCKHSYEQAEQCSLLIHYKGKYAVKSGDLSKLKPMKEAIIERGIQATIQ